MNAKDSFPDLLATYSFSMQPAEFLPAKFSMVGTAESAPFFMLTFVKAITQLTYARHWYDWAALWLSAATLLLLCLLWALPFTFLNTKSIMSRLCARFGRASSPEESYRL